MRRHFIFALAHVQTGHRLGVNRQAFERVDHDTEQARVGLNVCGCGCIPASTAYIDKPLLKTIAQIAKH
jgi:hypothetical protein